MLPTEPFAGRYTKLLHLGSGGFGAVFQAYDTRMRKSVAIKLLNRDLASNSHWRRRFEQEALLLSRLEENHPNITMVFDLGDFEGQPYIVMEFVKGETLAKVIETRVPLSDVERLLLIELCDGLDFAHQHQIVHRDIKPVNLMVRQDRTGAWRLKILDFGIAKVVNAEGSLTAGHVAFTPQYVPPELVLGQDVDARGDMFSVGAVAYELFALHRAFDIETAGKNPFQVLSEVKLKIVDQAHRPISKFRKDLDPELVSIIEKVLCKRRADRFADLAQMGKAVRRVRTRLEAETSQTTIVLSPRINAAISEGKLALERDNPSEAIGFLESAAALGGDFVRPFVDPMLAAAKERQAFRSPKTASRIV